jgi:hypothetical protein
VTSANNVTACYFGWKKTKTEAGYRLSVLILLERQNKNFIQILTQSPSFCYETQQKLVTFFWLKWLIFSIRFIEY